MRVEVGETGNIILRDIFNSIVLKTDWGEEFAICMRDSGFEFKYGGTWHSAQNGTIGFLHSTEEMDP